MNLTTVRARYRDYRWPSLGLLLLLALVPALLAESGGGDASTADAVLHASLFAGAGLACGFLNMVASSGSAVSLPLMIMLGMNPHVANATNRLPVLVGGITAVITFHRGGHLDWRLGLRLAPLVVIGSLAGALVAQALPARDLGPAITGAVLMALILLFTKVKKIIDGATAGEPRLDAIVYLAMLGIGFWAGFLVLDSATYLLLSLVVLVRCDLLHANALKSLLLSCATLVAFVLFVFAGDVQWGSGLLLSLGSVAGSYAGVRVAEIPTAKQWTFRLLAAVILLEVVHMGIKYALQIY